MLKEEWWHFDHASSRDYPNLNLPFEAILGSPRNGQGRTDPSGHHAGLEQRPGTAPALRAAGRGFVPVGAPLPVWVGGKGLAWRSDAGAPPPPAPGPVKREGDGRVPGGHADLRRHVGLRAPGPRGRAPSLPALHRLRPLRG